VFRRLASTRRIHDQVMGGGWCGKRKHEADDRDEYA
jgi:hypothetical protein